MATADRQATFFFNDITPESCLRIMDQMVVDWLRGLTFRNQHPRVQEAHISRQFAATHEAEEATNPDVKQAAPYPQITAQMTGISPDITRRNARGFMVNVGSNPRIWSPNDHTSLPIDSSDPRYAERAYVSDARDEIYLMPWPLAFDMEYQIDIVTKVQQDMVMLRSSLLARFESVDETYLYADFPGYGRQMIRVSLGRVADTSNLEPSEEIDRTLRSTVSITVHGWIFRVPVRKRTIKNMHVVIIDASGDDPNTDCPLDDGSAFLDFYNNPDNYVFNEDGSQLVSVAESPIFAPPNRVLFWLSRAPDGSLTFGP